MLASGLFPELDAAPVPPAPEWAEDEEQLRFERACARELRGDQD